MTVKTVPNYGHASACRSSQRSAVECWVLVETVTEKLKTIRGIVESMYLHLEVMRIVCIPFESVFITMKG
jgi:hypothetical protein